jgi:hypothetical protein
MLHLTPILLVLATRIIFVRAENSQLQRCLLRGCFRKFSGCKQEHVIKLKINENVIFQSAEKFDSGSDFAKISISYCYLAAKKFLNDPSFPIREYVCSQAHSHESTIGKDINAFASTIVNRM